MFPERVQELINRSSTCTNELATSLHAFDCSENKKSYSEPSDWVLQQHMIHRNTEYVRSHRKHFELRSHLHSRSSKVDKCLFSWQTMLTVSFEGGLPRVLLNNLTSIRVLSNQLPRLMYFVVLYAYSMRFDLPYSRSVLCNRFAIRTSARFFDSKPHPVLRGSFICAVVETPKRWLLVSLALR